MIREAARRLWAEPQAPNPPARVWRDWVLVAVLVPVAVVEAIVRDDLVWRPVSLAVCLALVPTLLWRRTHPLVMVAVAFGSFAAVDAVSIVAGVEWEGLDTGAFALLLPYALFRWGAGREAAVGLAIIMVPVLLSAFGPAPVSDLVGGVVIVLLAAQLGALVRYQDTARLRQIDEVKLREREQLARELHDTVAHHVSAIAIQAQAGRTLAASRPGAALEAIEVVEEEASRTLAEMRGLVGALRQDGEPELAPRAGVADIERLASGTGNGPQVDVELAGDLEDLPPPVDAALYRLAQESVTNALRHARHATRVRVRVTGGDHHVRLTVSDDGDARPGGAASPPGYGLVGMAERAKLLGGTLEAGPAGTSRDRGWTVRAVLPRTVAGS